MSAISRRETIVQLLRTSSVPVSGAALSKQCHVSRQIIVQDISWLRAAGYEILSTTKGYLLHTPPASTRMFFVQHTDAQIEDELTTIVDLGGTVLDVSVKHEVYGELKAPLYISSRLQITEFLESLKDRQAPPLKNLTGDKHRHTVEADSEHTLNLIQQALAQKGYLDTESYENNKIIS